MDVEVVGFCEVFSKKEVWRLFQKVPATSRTEHRNTLESASISKR